MPTVAVRRIILFILTAFLPFLVVAPLRAMELKGRVLRLDTKEAVPGAYALLRAGTNLAAQAAADEKGRFVLDFAVPARWLLTVKAAGFYADEREVDYKPNLDLVIYLTPQGILQMGEIDVVGKKDRGSVSKNTISKQMREKATASVMSDPVEVLTKLPGVESTLSRAGGDADNNQSTSRLSVRGGSGSENLAFMDGMMVAYPFHRGLFPDSLFIDDLVREITLYKGVLPPQYGQAMSSLLDVKLEEAQAGFHGKASIGLINTYGTLTGATEDGQWSWIAGVKRIYLDLVLDAALQFTSIPTNTNLQISVPYYLDSMGKVKWQTRYDTLSLLWLFSQESSKLQAVVSNTNRFVQRTSLGFETETPNYNLNLTWKHKFDEGLFIEQNFEGSILGSYQYLYFTNTSERVVENLRTSSQNALHYRALADWTPLKGFTVRPGAEAFWYPALQVTNLFYRLFTNSLTGQQESTNLINSGFNGSLGVWSGFLESEANLFGDALTVLGGLRGNWFDFLSKGSLDPRLTVQWKVLPQWKVYSAGGYLSQLTTDPGVFSLFDSNRASLDVPGCWHAVAGSEWSPNAGFTFSAEGYYKQYMNSITRESNLQEIYKTSGSGKNVWGAEILAMKKPGDFPVYGWVAFGTTRVFEYYEEGQNLGAAGIGTAPRPLNTWYASPDTVDYKLNVTAIWDITRNWSVTAEFDWGNGLHYTAVTGASNVIRGTNTVYYPIFGPYGQARLEDSHSLNLKLENKGLLWDIPYGWYIQVYNVYNHQQLAAVYYSKDYSQQYELRSPVGILPTAGFWLEW